MKLKSVDHIYHNNRDSSVKRWFFIILCLCIIVLILPWTQNIKVRGSVSTLYQEQRPQQLNSPIPGRILKWYVKNGDHVKKGDTLLQLAEVKEDYLDPLLVERTQQQVNAKIAEHLESENKAERFSILEPPIFPDKPIKPNRKKIIALGIFAALAGAIGLVALLEVLDKRVRGVDSLTALIKMRPLVVVPYITTQFELKKTKLLTKYVLIAVLALIILALAIIHFMITPLDLLMVKLLAKFA